MGRWVQKIKKAAHKEIAPERKGHVRAHRSFNRIWKERDSAEPDILGKILDKDNLNRAYKRVKTNKGAPGVDGMTIEAALPWLKEHNRELTERIRRGKYTPSPVRRVEIPKPDGGIRKLGIQLSSIALSNRRCSNSSCQSMSCCFRTTALAIDREEGQKTLYSG